jgi:hypothetical protein
MRRHPIKLLTQLGLCAGSAVAHHTMHERDDSPWRQFQQAKDVTEAIDRVNIDWFLISGSRQSIVEFHSSRLYVMIT